VALTLEDRVELLGLPARYGNAIDDRDWDALRTLFTKEAVFDVLPARVRLAGLEHIVTYMATTAVHPLSHLTLNAAVETHGGQVQLRFRALLPIAEPGGGLGPSRVIVGSYDDTMVRTSVGWRTRYRLFTRAPRGMKPTAADLARAHPLAKLHEADRRDMTEWLDKLKT
jgi:hypothetical protein